MCDTGQTGQCVNVIHMVFAIIYCKSGLKIHARKKRKCLGLLDRIIEISAPPDNQQENPAAVKDRKPVYFNSIYSKGENSYDGFIFPELHSVLVIAITGFLTTNTGGSYPAVWG